MRAIVICAFAFLLTQQCLATNGAPGVGWVKISGMEDDITVYPPCESDQTVCGPPTDFWDFGTVTLTVNGFTATYNYSGSDSGWDTPTTIAAGLASALNSNSSPVTAFATGAVITLTSKNLGAASNYSLSATSNTGLPSIFSGSSFTATPYNPTLAGGKDGPRNFRMIMYFDADTTNADMVFGNDPSVAQAPGHSVLPLGFSLWSSPNFAQQWQADIANYDMSRVEAVYIDEPYLGMLCPDPQHGNCPYSNFAINPCSATDGRYQVIQTGYNLLQAAAAAVKQSSPRTRFWINFSQPEMQWMQDPNCPANHPMALNGPYIDVVSLDYYQVDFPTVKPNYDWLVQHKGFSGQQLALVPGTFVFDSGPAADSGKQAQILGQYLDYATQMNQSCTLPLGGNPVTGIWDGCPVWMVAGFLLAHWTDPGGTTWHGLADPLAAPIQSLWQAQLSDSSVNPGMPVIPITAVQQLMQ